MLRVSCSDGDTQRWRLCGRLSGPWVDELRSCWRQARERTPLAEALLDLTEVTFIDDAGLALLREMRAAGATFVSAGVENKYLLASLEHLTTPREKIATNKGGDK